MRPKREPCQNCRRQHVKCDGAWPKCGRCQKSGRACLQVQPQVPQLQFRNSTSAQYNETQSRNTTLEYIDETPRLAGRYALDGPPPGYLPTPDPLLRLSSSLSQSQSPEIAHGTNPQSNSLPGHTWDQYSVSPSQTTRANTGSVLGLNQTGLNLGIAGTHSFSLFTTQFLLPQLALEEACLLRYFVEDLAKWFDLCDPERHFTYAVPQRARSCPPLLNAILSASARHFSTLPRSQQLDHSVKYGLQHGLVIGQETPLHYHSKCISHLRSLSKEPDEIMDENLLAAVVILRFYEELDSPFTDPPSETALRGLHVFIEAQATSALSSPGLRQAAFWVGFRQEFHLAFFQQRPFNLPLDGYERYHLWSTAPDHIWVNHLLIICAQIVQYCFDSERSTARYDELVERRNQWLRCCPPSFSPVYFEAANTGTGELFPRMWYLDDCHIVAIQSVGLINILITTYNPRTAHLSSGHTLALSCIDASLRSTVIEICGIALSNRQSPTALLTASIAIVACGERFVNRVEQQALMAILVRMSQDHNYWPSQSMQERLKQTWGWDE